VAPDGIFVLTAFPFLKTDYDESVDPSDNDAEPWFPPTSISVVVFPVLTLRFLV